MTKFGEDTVSVEQTEVLNPREAFVGLLDALAQAERSLDTGYAASRQAEVDLKGTRLGDKRGITERKVAEGTRKVIELYHQAIVAKLADQAGLSLPEDLFVDHWSRADDADRWNLEYLLQPRSFEFALKKLSQVEEQSE